MTIGRLSIECRLDVKTEDTVNEIFQPLRINSETLPPGQPLSGRPPGRLVFLIKEAVMPKYYGIKYGSSGDTREVNLASLSIGELGKISNGPFKGHRIIRTETGALDLDDPDQNFSFDVMSDQNAIPLPSGESITLTAK